MSTLIEDVIPNIIKYCDFSTVLNLLQCNTKYYNNDDCLILEALHQVINNQAVRDLNSWRSISHNLLIHQDVEFDLQIFADPETDALFEENKKITRADYTKLNIPRLDLRTLHCLNLCIEPLENNFDLIGCQNIQYWEYREA